MRLFSWTQPSDNQPPQLPPVETDYSRLIVENFAYIEKQCRQAVSRNRWAGSGSGMEGVIGNLDYCNAGLANEADELLNEVVDRLKADDFKALREFKGKSKLTTYITTIITNLVIDIVRRKKGRSRARERAEEMGEVACKLYDLVFGRGCSLHDAQGHLETAFGICEPLEKLQEMLDRMRGRGKGQILTAGDGATAWLATGKEVMTADGIEIVVPDPASSSEEMMINRQKVSLAKQAVNELLLELNGEDRLMIRMRFPANDGEEPKSVKEIGQLLGLTEKVADSRIRRILVRFREVLLRRGLALDDLIDV